ncbi:hypothetical protein GCM10009863_19960 [Streptomyces axinellae]|uniref:Cell shape-determining protein MreB n=1 Tax=Streptomyces axinellae TaxID=552788 RepID=A0ABP6C7R3_9ACTN
MGCSSLEDLNRCSVAVDLGAARTRVHVKGTGLIVDQPSVVAVNTHSGALIAVGEAAALMDGRTPRHIRVDRPVSGGTVTDIDMARRMLRALVGERLHGLRRRRVLLRAAATIPHNADPLARRATVETLTGVGARRVELVDTPTAAALGCGLPVERPEATMILVCGAATTQVAVLSLGSIVAAGTVSLGGEIIHRAVVQYLRDRHELLLPSQAVRPLHLALNGGEGAEQVAEVQGRDVVTGLARSVIIDPEDVRRAIQTPLTGLTDTIRAVLHRCPPDLVADLAERGMVLTGGSALLPGLAERLRAATGMAVRLSEQPELSAVSGLAAMLEGRVQPFVGEIAAGTAGRETEVKAEVGIAPEPTVEPVTASVMGAAAGAVVGVGAVPSPGSGAGPVSEPEEPSAEASRSVTGPAGAATGAGPAPESRPEPTRETTRGMTPDLMPEPAAPAPAERGGPAPDPAPDTTPDAAPGSAAGTAAAAG